MKRVYIFLSALFISSYSQKNFAYQVHLPPLKIQYVSSDEFPLPPVAVRLEAYDYIKPLGFIGLVLIRGDEVMDTFYSKTFTSSSDGVARLPGLKLSRPFSKQEPKITVTILGFKAVREACRGKETRFDDNITPGLDFDSDECSFDSQWIPFKAIPKEMKCKLTRSFAEYEERITAAVKRCRE